MDEQTPQTPRTPSAPDEAAAPAAVQAAEEALTNGAPPRSSRTRTVMWGVATVAVLALVILVGGALSRSDTPPAVDNIEVQGTTESANLTQQGQAALESGDATKAATLLAKAVAADPANETAKTLLAQARKEQQASKPVVKPTPDEDDDDAPEPSKPDPFASAVKEIGKLLPTRFSGYTFGSPLVEGGEATVSGRPGAANAAAASVVWAVHDKKTPAEAAKFIDKVSKAAYPQQSTTVDIDGANAYYGTDGARFVTVTYVRGRYVFEVIVGANGALSADSRRVAEQASLAFPDKP